MTSFLIAELREALTVSTIKNDVITYSCENEAAQVCMHILETFSESETRWKQLGTRPFQLHTDICLYLLFGWFDNRLVDIALESRGLWIDSHNRHELSHSTDHT